MDELTAEQKQRIEYLATDAWVVDIGEPDDDVRSNENFHLALALMSSIELHHFACNFNWDCGVEELRAVVDHPECDAGTALMIFWLGQPAYYFRKAKKNSLSTHECETFELVDYLSKRLQSGSFEHSQIACDPFLVRATGSDREREVIAAKLFEKVEGMQIEPYMC